MVKRKAKSKSKKKIIHLKNRSRRSSRRKRYSYRSHTVWNGFLDKNISVRSLLKYSGTTLAFILVFVFVFMLGRFSVTTTDTGNPSGSAQLSSQVTQVTESNPEPEEKVSETQSVSDDDQKAELSDKPEPDIVNLSENDIDEEEETEQEPEETEEEEEPSCKPEIAEFDYSYRLVEIDVSNFNKEVRGDNWATLTSLKLTITNKEPCTIINPTQIKIKLNNKGKGSIWWDDEVFLPASFKSMYPGDTVSEIVPIHVSYSDIYSEKDFRLTVFDDYDIEIGVFKEYMTFS